MGDKLYVEPLSALNLCVSKCISKEYNTMMTTVSVGWRKLMKGQGFGYIFLACSFSHDTLIMHLAGSLAEESLPKKKYFPSL